MHVYPEIVKSDFTLVCPWLSMLADGFSLSSKHVKEIAGNAMHVPTVGSLLVWSVANFELSLKASDEPASKRSR